MRTLLVFSKKGGVGKTATVSNLARAFSLGEENVLVIDTDPQAHLSLSFLGTADTNGLSDYLHSSEAPSKYLTPSKTGVSVIASGHTLQQFVEQQPGADLLQKIDELLVYAKHHFTTTVIDCPPVANWITQQIMRHESEVLIPVASDYLALQGLSDILKQIKEVEEEVGRTINYNVLLTRFDKRKKLAREVRQQIEQYFPDRVAPQPIRECVAIAEAPSHGLSVLDYRPASNGAIDYKNLATYLRSQ